MNDNNMYLFERKKRQAQQTDGGFSLIEMLVSVSIFSIVTLIAVSALLSIVDANRKARAVHSVMNNLNFSLDSMSRTIRTGYDYHCGDLTNIQTPQSCSGGDTVLALEATDGNDNDASDQIAYRLNNGRIERSRDGGSSFSAITAPEVTITDFSFYVTGTTRGDNEQPQVVITMQGTAGENEIASDFRIQTTITQRLIDL